MWRDIGGREEPVGTTGSTLEYSQLFSTGCRCAADLWCWSAGRVWRVHRLA